MTNPKNADPAVLGGVLRRRYRFLRKHVGADVLSAAFIALLNELSDLPDNKCGFMHIIWTMPREARNE